jgi:hypothetical protein
MQFITESVLVTLDSRQTFRTFMLTIAPEPSHSLIN